MTNVPTTIMLQLCVLSVACASVLASEPAGDQPTWPPSKQFGFERRNFTVDGHSAFVILPTEARKSMPWVWYAPTFVGKTQETSTPNFANEWISSRLLAQGIAVCGVDVGDSLGSAAGRAGFTRFYDYVVPTFGLATKAGLWAQSRGGLMLINWAVEHPGSVKCIGGTYPVCDLRSYPGLKAAAGAYGVTEEQLGASLAENNPIDRLAPLAAARVPIFCVHGDSDTVVPLDANSAELACRYAKLGGSIELKVAPGKGHDTSPDFFECQEMVDFFIRHLRQ